MFTSGWTVNSLSIDKASPSPSEVALTLTRLNCTTEKAKFPHTRTHRPNRSRPKTRIAGRAPPPKQKPRLSVHFKERIGKLWLILETWNNKRYTYTHFAETFPNTQIPQAHIAIGSSRQIQKRQGETNFRSGFSSREKEGTPRHSETRRSIQSTRVGARDNTNTEAMAEPISSLS